MPDTSSIILLALNAILAIGGFIGVFMLQRLMSKIDHLEKNDRRLEDTVTRHREDVLKNYATIPDLEGIKKDIMERLDRFEASVLSFIKTRN